MKVAIIGAAGNVGQRLVAEALARNHSVTAIGPTLEKLESLVNVSPLYGSFTDIAQLAENLKGHDAIISAVRFVKYAPSDLMRAVKEAEVSRLLVAGGAGSLKTPDGQLVVESASFPEGALPEAKAGAALLAELQASEGLDWSFLSPSIMFAAGVRTGEFRLGLDNLLVDENGKSQISYEDFAVALLDELEDNRHLRQRFTVGY